MSKFKIIVAEKIDKAGIEYLQKHADVDVCIGISREELLEKIENYDALVVRSATKVNAELLEKGKKLKIVGRAGNGIDNISVEEATKRGVIVANTPESNIISACEISIALMFAGARSICYADKETKSGKWIRNQLEGTELFGKTLGIVGLGRIGGLMATRMKAMGMNLIAYDPYISDERFEKYGVTKKETLEELCKEADIITVHTPKTEETKGMISYKQIELMKDGVHLVNGARGGIIDEKAAYDGLKSGKIASFGLDVHETEPRTESPLYELDNVTVTPHIGANTYDAQRNVGLNIAEQIINGLNGEIVENAVNLPTMNRDELKEAKPYLNLLEKIGKMYYQYNKETVKAIEVSYWGEAAKQYTEMMDIAFLKGFLSTVMSEKVNYINAKIFAEKNGIALNIQKNKQEYKNHSNAVKIKYILKDKEIVFLGNIASNGEPKLLEIDGYEVDVKLTDYLLLINNNDVPGVIGKVGTIVGDENINVATMTVARKQKGDKALMVLNVDDYIADEVLAKFNNCSDINFAKSVKL
jgi:D-3-phosphoglycerate dehydrogenase